MTTYFWAPLMVYAVMAMVMLFGFGLATLMKEYHHVGYASVKDFYHAAAGYLAPSLSALMAITAVVEPDQLGTLVPSPIRETIVTMFLAVAVGSSAVDIFRTTGVNGLHVSFTFRPS